MQTQRLLWGLGRNQPQSGFKRAEALLRVLGRTQQIYTKRAFSFNKLLNENALF